MHVGESATLRVPCAAGYGATGVRAPDGTVVVPAGADLEFALELVAAAPAAATSAPAAPDALADAEALKEQGNARLSRGDASGARYKYRLALSVLGVPPLGQAADQGSGTAGAAGRRALPPSARAAALLGALHANVAKACLDLGLHAEAADACTAVLALAADAADAGRGSGDDGGAAASSGSYAGSSPAARPPVPPVDAFPVLPVDKALYRRALARDAQGRRADAVADAEALTKQFPGNPAGAELLKRWAAPADAPAVQAATVDAGDNAVAAAVGAVHSTAGGAAAGVETAPTPAPLVPHAPARAVSAADDTPADGTRPRRRRAPAAADSVAAAMGRALGGGGLYADAPGYDKPIETRMARGAAGGGDGGGWRGALAAARSAVAAWCPCCRRRGDGGTRA